MSAAPRLTSGLQYKVIFQRGPLAGQNFDFTAVKVQIGRGAENDLVLLNDLRASRQHAEIRWDGEQLKIVNLSSKNFIIVNGSQEESAVLENGSVVMIGESEFRLEYPEGSLGRTESATSSDEAADSELKTKLIVIETPPVTAMPQVTPAPTAYLRPTSASPVAPTATPSPLASPMINTSANGQSFTGGYGTHSARPRSRSTATPGLAANPKVRFYAIVAVLGLVVFWFFSSGGAKKKELTFRSTEQIEKDIEASREEIKEFEARREKLDNVQYRRAQENYIRGFRDYKQGNYGRAREAFQVVLNLDPDNELAKRYYQLSKVKFDEMVKFHMLQGNRYREKKNWRMCTSSYFNVMTMLNNGQDPLFKEAKQYFDQCTLAQQGNY
jgi:pSer/pThr/pTyr-binding forkhead associated (FHA) protein